MKSSINDKWLENMLEDIEVKRTQSPRHKLKEFVKGLLNEPHCTSDQFTIINLLYNELKDQLSTAIPSGGQLPQMILGESREAAFDILYKKLFEEERSQHNQPEGE